MAGLSRPHGGENEAEARGPEELPGDDHRLRLQDGQRLRDVGGEAPTDIFTPRTLLRFFRNPAWSLQDYPPHNGKYGDPGLPRALYLAESAGEATQRRDIPLTSGRA